MSSLTQAPETVTVQETACWVLLRQFGGQGYKYREPTAIEGAHPRGWEAGAEGEPHLRAPGHCPRRPRRGAEMLKAYRRRGAVKAGWPTEGSHEDTAPPLLAHLGSSHPGAGVGGAAASRPGL